MDLNLIKVVSAGTQGNNCCALLHILFNMEVVIMKFTLYLNRTFMVNLIPVKVDLQSYSRFHCFHA